MDLKKSVENLHCMIEQGAVEDEVWDALDAVHYIHQAEMTLNRYYHKYCSVEMCYVREDPENGQN